MDYFFSVRSGLSYFSTHFHIIETNCHCTPFTGVTDTLDTGLDYELRDLVTSVSDAVDDITDNTQTGLDNVGDESVLVTVGHVVTGVGEGVEELMPGNRKPEPEEVPIQFDSMG